MSGRINYLDWTEYEAKKEGDKNLFDANAEWERAFLAAKIKRIFPQYSTEQILEAIAETASLIGAVRKRYIFIECVMLRLKK